MCYLYNMIGFARGFMAGEPWKKNFTYFVVNSLHCAGEVMISVLIIYVYKYMVHLRQSRHYAPQETLRPVYQRAAWSLTCAFHGRRPLHGPNGQESELTARELRLAKQKPDLSRRYATVEYKGDQKYMRETFQLQQNWQRALICHRCNASRLSKHGILFTNFGHNWTTYSNVEAMLKIMPPTPNPLVLVPGFHISMLILGYALCSMFFAFELEASQGRWNTTQDLKP